VQTTRSNDVQKRSRSSGDHQRIQVSHHNQSINQSEHVHDDDNDISDEMCSTCVSDAILSHDSEAVQDRVLSLEKKVQQQDDEITCLKSALADALRRLAALESGASVCLSVSISLSASVCLSIYLFVSICLSASVCLHLSVYLSVCLSVCLSASVCLHLSVSICLSASVCLSVCICLSASVCLSICLSVYLSVSLSVCLSASVSLSVYADLMLIVFINSSLAVHLTSAHW